MLAAWVDDQPDVSIGRPDKVLDQTQAIGHAAMTFGPLKKVPLAHQAVSLVLGNDRRADRVPRAASRIGGDSPACRPAEFIGKTADPQGGRLGGLALGEVVGEDVHPLIAVQAAAAGSRSHMEKDCAREDAAVDGDVYLERRVELGVKHDVVGLKKLGKPGALGPGSPAKIIAGED